jgi:hypothetical protein
MRIFWLWFVVVWGVGWGVGLRGFFFVLEEMTMWWGGGVCCSFETTRNIK